MTPVGPHAATLLVLAIAARGLTLAALLLASAAHAQPWAADEGFGRPHAISETSISPTVALASDGSTTSAFWNDRAGVLRLELPAEGRGTAERVVEGRGIRGVYAAGGEQGVALGWVRRDLATGSTAHLVQWADERRLVLEALQPYELALAMGPDGPVALYSKQFEGRDQLRVWSWDGSEFVLRSSELSIANYRLAFDESGQGWAVWLEGFTDRNAVGVGFAQWDAYLAPLAAAGEGRAPEHLGAASNRGIRSAPAVGFLGGRTWVLWPTDDGSLAASTPGAEPLRVGPGFALGIAGGHAYWAEGESIRRIPLGRSGASSEDSTGSVVNVLWSPVPVERGTIASDPEGRLFAAWYGGRHGGGYELYAADDTSAMERGLRDRLAAVMGWNPWALWQALAGQVLAALFAGLVLTVAFTPVLWLGAALMARRWTAPADTTLAGITLATALGLGALTMLALALALEEAARRAIVGSPPLWLASFATAALLTWSMRRRSDSEPLLGVLASACLTSYIGFSLLGFFTFAGWAGLLATLA